MKILVLGAGKMGSFFTDLLSFEHEVAVYDKEPLRMRFTYNCARFSSLEEVKQFEPQLLINAVTMKYTIAAFEAVMPFLPQQCIISDIASVKTGLHAYYERCNRPFVSSHPMFGRIFFRDLYGRLGLNIHEYTFEQHDRTVAYSLSIPFVSTFVFAAVMKPQDAPGTTFKRHLNIARGVLGEDDFLLREILFNPYTAEQVGHIRDELNNLLEIIDRKDADGMKEYLAKIRKSVEKAV